LYAAIDSIVPLSAMYAEQLAWDLKRVKFVSELTDYNTLTAYVSELTD
jgi:hypothetical protein